MLWLWNATSGGTDGGIDDRCSVRRPDVPYEGSFVLDKPGSPILERERQLSLRYSWQSMSNGAAQGRRGGQLVVNQVAQMHGTAAGQQLAQDSERREGSSERIFPGSPVSCSQVAFRAMHEAGSLAKARTEYRSPAVQ